MLLGLRLVLFSACVTAGVIKPKNTQSKPGGKWKTYYECEENIVETEWVYHVNITLNRTATFQDSWDTQLVASDPAETWYYVKSVFWAFPPRVEVDFSLTYKGYKPTGNCTWYFGSSGQSTTEQTSPPSTTTTINTTSTTNISTEVTTETTTTTEISTVTSTNFTMTTEPSNDSCLCLCPCQAKTEQDIEEFMSYIINDLIIAKNSTYKAKQRLVCASDERWISRGIGFVGVLVLTLVFGSIVVGDLKVFVENIKTALNRMNLN